MNMLNYSMLYENSCVFFLKVKDARMTLVILWNFENFGYRNRIKKPAKSNLQAFITFDGVLCGEWGIRTRGPFNKSTVFKTAAIDHSANSPGSKVQTLLKSTRMKVLFFSSLL